MKLTDILTANCIRVPLEAADKTGTITELVDLLADQGLLTDRDLVLQAILDRERTASTGIGQGLAVPHGKSSGCDRLVMALGKPAEPLDFDSKDGKPVEIIVLLASPPQKTGPHIQALARISRLMMMESFRQGVRAAGSAEALWDVVCAHEQ